MLDKAGKKEKKTPNILKVLLINNFLKHINNAFGQH